MRAYLTLFLSLLSLIFIDIRHSEAATSTGAGLQVPCYAPQGLLFLPSTQNTKLPLCTQVIPVIKSLIQSSILTRIEAYYHGCDVGAASGQQTLQAGAAPATAASPVPVPTSCAGAATLYQDTCGNSNSPFPGTPCDSFAPTDFQVFGITSGCPAETTTNHTGASCGSYMTLAASMNSSPLGNPNPTQACMVSGTVTPGVVQAESSLMLGMLIHSLAYNLNKVIGEISTGSLNLSSPTAISLALGSGSYGNAVSSVEGKVPQMTVQLQGQANIGDLLICTGTAQPGNPIQSNGLFISGCQTNSYFQSLVTTYGQIAVVEAYYRAYQSYQEFVSGAASFSQLAIQSLKFTQSTCTAAQAQTQYEKQYPTTIEEQANGQWQ